MFYIGNTLYGYSKKEYGSTYYNNTLLILT